MTEPGDPAACRSPETKRALLARLLRERTEQATVGHPLSNGQRALWFLHQLAPASTANNEAFAWRNPGALDAPALQAVLQQLVERHPALRTTYTTRDGAPWAVVHPQQPVPLDATDARNWTDDELQDALTRESNRPFDLERDPLMRLHVFDRSGSHVLLTVIHHVTIDLWSMGVIREDLQALFLARKLGVPARLPPPAPAYQDFVAWEAEMLRGPEGDRQRDYWLRRLAGPLPVLQLPTDRPRPPAQTFRGRTFPFRLGAALSARLEALARAQRTTLYTVLLAAYQVLLHRYCGQDDILVGSVMSGRSQARFERIVGYLANPVVLRADLSGDPPFARFLAQVWQTVTEAIDHQNYPFSLLVERLLRQRDPGRGPLVDAVFVLQRPQRGQDRVDKTENRGIETFGVADRREKGATVDFGGARSELFLVEHHIAKFDLELQMYEVGDELAGWFRYSTDLFGPETITRFSSNFLALLEGLVQRPEHRVSELPLLSATERRAVLKVSAPAQPVRGPLPYTRPSLGFNPGA